MITSLIFDCVGPLLIKTKPSSQKLIGEIDSLCGSVTNDELFIEQIMNKYAKKRTEVEEIMIEIANQYDINTQMFEFIKLQKGTYKMGVINNGTAVIFNYWKEKYHLNELFDSCVNSAESGVRKPERKIYEIMSGNLNIPLDECVFIDDSSQNVVAATQYGMKGIVYDPEKHEDFLREVEAML